MRARATAKRLGVPAALGFFDYTALFICLVLVPSAVIQGLAGLDERTFFAVLVPIVVTGSLLSKHSFLGGTQLLLIVVLTIIGALASAVAGSYSQLLMGAALSAAVIAGYQLCRSLRKSVALLMASWFALLLLVGGVVGALYYFFGGASLLDVKIGYRTTHLFLSTFSFAEIGQFIRPSGIFDEPGAFLMYVAIITMFNDTLQQNRRLNFVLVALMILTGSLSGLLLAALYLLASNAMKESRAVAITLVASLVGVFFLAQYLFPSNPISTAVDTFYSERLQLVDGRLAGDNRSNQISDFFALVDEDMLLRGVPLETEDAAIDMSSNPFSIIFRYGLIISIPYFALLGWLITTTLSNRLDHAYASIGLFFLMLQRPYLFHMSWSIMIVSVVWLLYTVSDRRPKQRRLGEIRLRSGVPQ